VRCRPAFLGALTALAVGALLAVPMSASQAVFAADCSAPTRTLAGGSNQPITVAAGERLLLTGGTFTGGVDSFPEGSFLCVAGSASLAPAYLNNAAGTLDIAPGGTASFPSISVATGFLLDNQGSATFAGLNVNGAADIRNLPGGTMRVSSQFSPSAGGIVNNGSFTTIRNQMIQGFNNGGLSGISSSTDGSQILALPAKQVLPFVALGGAIGLVLGGSQALSRSLFSQLIPHGKEAEYFGLYEISDKGTSWLGPLLFGLAYDITRSYRVAIVSLLVFFVVGMALLLAVPMRRAIAAAGNVPPHKL